MVPLVTLPPTLIALSATDRANPLIVLPVMDVLNILPVSAALMAPTTIALLPASVIELLSIEMLAILDADWMRQKILVCAMPLNTLPLMFQLNRLAASEPSILTAPHPSM